MKHLSLFSGIGGIDLAAEWVGFESVAFVERDKFCQQVLSKNFPGVPIFGDVCEFDGTEYENKIDLVSAGFPCQPFSQAGKRKGASDERALWPQVCRILRETKPQWFLGENVPGLLTIDGGQYFGQILNDLAEIGYSVGWIVYGAKDVGAVHRRNRVFIVAYSNSVRRSQYSHSEWTQLGPGRTAQCRVEGHDSCICGRDVTNSDGLRRYDGFNHWGARSVRDSEVGEASENKQEWNKREPRTCADDDVSTNSESEPSNGGGLAEPLRSDSQAQESGCGDCKGYACNPESQPRLQTDSPTCSIGSERDARQDFGGRHWQPISGGNWREWDTCPIVYETRSKSRVRRTDDGLSHRVDRLKALGNAVVPQQVYPILVEIARQMK